MHKLKGENLATSVIVLEWLMTVAQCIGLIWYLTYLGDHPEIAAQVNINPTTLIIWASLFSIGLIILFIFLSTVLTQGILKKCTRYLSLWVILQYIVFVVTFVAVVANMIGYLDMGWFWILLILSLIYRFFILKVISEFNQEIGMERDKERRRSAMDLRQSELSGSTSTSPTPAKLTQNNLQFHNSQYIPLPIQQAQHYIPPDYNTRPMRSEPEYISIEKQPVATISQPYRTHRPPLRPGYLTRSFSESSV